MAASAPAVQGVAVDGVAVMGVEVAERTVAEVIGDAQRLGEQLGDPLYNTGDLACVYFLYRRTAEEIVARCGASGQSVRDALQKALVEAAEQYGSGASAATIRDAAETMRLMFKDMNSKGGATRSVLLGAMPSVGSLLAEGYPELARSEDYPKGSIKTKLTTLRGAIAQTTKETKHIVDKGNELGAYYVLGKAIDDMVAHLGDGGSDAQAAQALRDLRARGDAKASGGVGGARTAVSEMLQGLVALSRAPINPSLSAGVTNPFKFTTEAGFPGDDGDDDGNGGGGGGGGCCVVA
jgi:hypothetical protein